MKNSYVIIFICMILSIGIISAATFDNRNYFYPEVGEYGKVEIRDWFGLLKLSELELKENTELCIENNCYAKKEIIMYQKGALVDDVRFIDLKNNKETDIKEHHFEIYKDGKWINYNYEEVEEGTYQLRLEGKILPFQSVDWQIKSQGIWIEDWAIWNSGFNEQLLHYWDFNEGTGTNVEDVRGEVFGHQYNGTLFNNAVFRTGKSGTGIYLDGTDDFVNLTVVGVSNINGSSNFTINVWTNKTAASFSSMFSDDVAAQNFDFMDGGDQTIYGYMEGSSWSATSDNVTYDGSNWTMLTWTRKGDNQTLYSDGAIIVSATRTQTPTQANTFRFGTDAGESNDLAGMIDEYSVWNRSLTDDEIIDLWNKGDGIFFEKVFNFFVIVFPENITYGEEVTNLNYTKGNIAYCWQSPDEGITNTSAVIAGVNWTTLNSVEGSNTWTLYCNDTAGVQYNDSITFTVDSLGPNISVIQPRGLIDIGEINTNLTLNWTVLDSSLDSCWYDYNGTNTSVTCSENVTGVFITDSINRNLTFYSNDSIGNVTSNFTSWDYKIFVNNITYNATTYETSSEDFTINISSNGTQTVTANLYYNGTNKGASTKIGDNTEMTFKSTIDIDTTDTFSNKSFFWSFNYGIENINNSKRNQSVNLALLDYCNSTLTTIYINISFLNETTDKEPVNASIDTSWIYYLGNGVINKTLTYSNSTEGINFPFCFSPPDKTITTILDMSYTNGESQQRTYNPTLVLSNVTTQTRLYLLPTVLGLFNPFKTTTTLGSAISLVSGVITRTLGGSTITVASDFTDSSGFVTFFLNPDVTYTALFTKSGFADNQFTFVPTTDLRTIIMGTGAARIGNGTVIVGNTTYEIIPRNTTLLNNTDFTFAFNVSSTQSITLIRMNITNSTGSQIGFQSNAGAGYISEIINTENLTKIIGRYLIQTSEETITVSKVWIVGTEFVGDYSIYRQFTLFNEYGFQDFIKFLMVFAVIIGTLIFMSAGEVIESSESKVIVAVLVVWAFSIVGWLDTGLAVNSSQTSINKLGEISSQFGIAILSTGAGVFFVFRRIFL